MPEYVQIDNLVLNTPLEVELPSEYEFLFISDSHDAIIIEAF